MVMVSGMEALPPRSRPCSSAGSATGGNTAALPMLVWRQKQIPDCVAGGGPPATGAPQPPVALKTELGQRNSGHGPSCPEFLCFIA